MSVYLSVYPSFRPSSVCRLTCLSVYWYMYSLAQTARACLSSRAVKTDMDRFMEIDRWRDNPHLCAYADVLGRCATSTHNEYIRVRMRAHTQVETSSPRFIHVPMFMYLKVYAKSSSPRLWKSPRSACRCMCQSPASRCLTKLARASTHMHTDDSWLLCIFIHTCIH